MNNALDGIANEYVDYVMDLNAKLQRLAFDCEKHRFVLVDLPRQLRRTHASVPKVIDDYHWITITKKKNMLEPASLGRWVRRELPDWFH